MFASNSSSRRRSRATMSISILSLLMCTTVSFGFLQTPSVGPSAYVRFPATATPERAFFGSHRPSTALNVWWFGGTEQSEVSGSNDSCELVAIRIEKTSANSRKIAGEITVPASMEDVWSILTDYDRLAIHVPNLRESRVIQRNSRGEPGDGSYRCRLFQVGAQKIIGFDFSASVTMDMTEKIISAANGASKERMIGFKCVESQFFNEFDGEWKVKEQMGLDGQVETLCSYVVEVRPKGPVPVAALEWRIREDVPTNLRAVKAAAIGSLQRDSFPTRSISSLSPAYVQSNGVRSRNSRSQDLAQRFVPVMLDWDRDETMAKYL